MKNTLYCLLLFICNICFSQEEIIKNNPKEIAVFKFYPNPAQDDLYILGTHKIKSIELINTLGKRVAFYHFNKSIIRINVSELNSGIYLIQVIDENNTSDTKKLVIK
jgi:hypothetical protein